jgi:hypothetical protein
VTRTYAVPTIADAVETTEDRREATTEDGAQETTEDRAEETTEDRAEETTEDGTEETKKDGTEETKEDGSEEKTEDGTEETTATFVTTPEPDDITTETENYTKDYAITEEIDTEMNENPITLPVESNKAVQVC